MPTVRAEGSDNNVTVKTDYNVDQGRAYHSAYFEMLGEQGYVGFGLWAWIQTLGIWQMARLRRRWKNRTGPDNGWIAPLANALQISQLIYFLGALFVGIAFQPVMLTIIALQCGLWSYCRRIDAPAQRPVLTGPNRLVVHPA